MDDKYGPEVSRRTEQIAKLIDAMDHRAHQVAKGSCFLIISERPGDDSERRSLRARRSVWRRVTASVGGRVSSEHAWTCGQTNCDRTNENDDYVPRFVQWCFDFRRFAIDLPNSTLTSSEGKAIIHAKPGFFYEAQSPTPGVSCESDIRRWNSLIKFYLYGDARQAAQEAGWILFQLWKLPVDSRLYIRASSFHKRFRWEWDVPLE